MSIFNLETTVAMIEAAKDLTAHASVKDADQVASNFGQIYQAIATAVLTANTPDTYRQPPSKPPTQ